MIRKFNPFALVFGLGVMSLGAIVFGPAPASGQKPQSYDYTAELKFQTLISGAVTALNIVWKCDAMACKTSGPWPVPGVGACAALAEKVGDIVSYGHSQRKLSPADIATCNAKAAKQPSPKSPVPSKNIPPPSKLPKGPPQPGKNIPPETAPPPGGGAFAPKSIRTQTLMVTGTGAFATAPPFTPVAVRTPTLTVTGTGAFTALPPFTPKVVKTPPLTVTGAGSLE